jgi:hypothetical protein
MNRKVKEILQNKKQYRVLDTFKGDRENIVLGERKYMYI